MLKVRVIPTLLLKEFGLVKGIGFDSWRRVGPVLPAVRVYNQRDVDELVLLDVLAHSSTDGPDCQLILDLSRYCFVPLTVGGGIQTVEHVRGVLRSGADKVSLNTSALVDPNIVTAIANQFGDQCVVGSIDVRQVDVGRWRCFSGSGSRDSGRDAIEWARELADRGAGELLITSIERDGTMRGYDLSLIEEIASAVDVPVIASGGAGIYRHMIDAVLQSGASAVAAASMFHFTEQTPGGARDALAAAGIAVRHPLQDSSR